jgi:hypothetical protein
MPALPAEQESAAESFLSCFLPMGNNSLTMPQPAVNCGSLVIDRLKECNSIVVLAAWLRGVLIVNLERQAG